VEVGNEGERPPSLSPAAVENDRPGLGDGERAAGEGAVEAVELLRGEAAVGDRLLRPPRIGQIGRHGEPAAADEVAEHVLQIARRSADNSGAVLPGPLGKQIDDLLSRSRVRAAVVALHFRRLRSLRER
jgi:hypothetical protein